MTTNLVLPQKVLDLLKAIAECRDRSSVGLARHLGLPPGPSAVKAAPAFKALSDQLKHRGLIVFKGRGGWTLTDKGQALYLVHFGRRDVITHEVGEGVRIGVIMGAELVAGDMLRLTVTWRQGSTRTPGTYVLELDRITGLDLVGTDSVEILLDGSGSLLTFSPFGSTVANSALGAAA